ncbi:MAG: YIP1 family protein [Bacteroidales bacterium]|nr:YIP1 family protein [Bacteroidales bacterium]
MKITSRVKNIVFNGRNEWVVITNENQPASAIFLIHVLPLSIFFSVTGFIGFGLIGQIKPFIGHIGSVSLGLRYAVVFLITLTGGVILPAILTNYVTHKFSHRKNFDGIFRLIAYSYTPVMAAGIFCLLPSLVILIVPAYIQSIFLVYSGLKPVLNIPDNKINNFFSFL